MSSGAPARCMRNKPGELFPRSSGYPTGSSVVLRDKNIILNLGRRRNVPKPPKPLIDYLRTGRCVLFAGSGLSAWANLPTWGQFLDEVIAEIHALDEDRDREEITRLFEAGKLLEIADHCKERLGEQRYSEILTARLSGNEGSIPEIHKIITQIPFAALVTTNYDKLLERAYASMTNAIPKTPTHLDLDTLGPLLFNGSFFILKAHGDIDRPKSLILTTSDYRELIHSNPAFNTIFSAILLTKAILFVGYSLSDPDFRLLLDRQLTLFKGHIPERYALMSGVGSVEREVLWRTARIRVLPYPDGQHQEVKSFLKSLQEEVPEVRAATAPAVPAAYEIEVPPTVLSTTIAIQSQGLDIQVTVETGQHTIAGAGRLPDWAELAKMMRSAMSGSDGEYGPKDVSEILAGSLSEEVSKALRKLPRESLVVLRLSSELSTLPWEWISVGDTYLFAQHPIVRAPIGISDKARGYPLIRQPIRVLLIGDPTDKFPGARNEIRRIAKVYSKYPDVQCKSLIGKEANFDLVVSELRSPDYYDVVHFAGYSWFDANESYVTLYGDVILRASEFQTFLSQRPPAILFLNSHYTAFVPPGVLGSDIRSGAADKEMAPTNVASSVGGRMGFTDVAATTGVGAFIGCFGSPSDATAAQIGVNFHRTLMDGLPVSAALYKARLPISKRDAAEIDPSWLFYIVSGYGGLVLPRVQVPRETRSGGARTAASR